MFLFQVAALQLPGERVFYEDFSNNDRNWHAGYYKDRSTLVKEGSYVVEGGKSSSNCFANQLIQLDPTKDFSISVKMMHLSGDWNNGYGITFGHDDQDAEYTTLITADGQYNIHTRSRTIIDWAVCNAIFPMDTYNKITVIKNGDICTLYLNDKPVNTFSTANFSSDKHFFVGLISLGRQKVRFDDVEVYGSK